MQRSCDHFRVSPGTSQRLRALCWTPYFTDGILAGVAGVFNPAGLFYLIASALPSTLGANAGLTSLPSMMRHRKLENAPILNPRSSVWIVVAAVASLFFIFVLGSGITWSR